MKFEAKNFEFLISKSTTSEQACLSGMTGLPDGRQAHEGPSGME